MIFVMVVVVVIDIYNNEGKFLVRFSNKFTQARCRVPLPSNPDLLSHAKCASSLSFVFHLRVKFSTFHSRSHPKHETPHGSAALE